MKTITKKIIISIAVTLLSLLTTAAFIHLCICNELPNFLITLYSIGLGILLGITILTIDEIQ